MEEFEENLERIKGDRFYDPDVDHEEVYQTKGRRAQNKERTHDVLHKYQHYRYERKLHKQKKKLLKLLDLDTDSIPSECFKEDDDGSDEEDELDCTSRATS